MKLTIYAPAISGENKITFLDKGSWVTFRSLRVVFGEIKFNH